MHNLHIRRIKQLENRKIRRKFSTFQHKYQTFEMAST